MSEKYHPPGIVANDRVLAAYLLPCRPQANYRIGSAYLLFRFPVLLQQTVDHLYEYRFFVRRKFACLFKPFPEFVILGHSGSPHSFQPVKLIIGYTEKLSELCQFLCERLSFSGLVGSHQGLAAPQTFRKVLLCPAFQLAEIPDIFRQCIWDSLHMVKNRKECPKVIQSICTL